MQFTEGNGGSEDSKNFVRLKDGENVKGVFRGDPYTFKTHWSGTHSVLCADDGACAMCQASGKKGKFRFRINFIVNENGQLVPKVFEQGWKAYLALKELHAEYNLEKTVIKVGRTGSGQNDTSYSFLPAAGGAVTPDMEAKLAAVKLIDLRHSEEDLTPAAFPKPLSEADAPF